MPLVQRLEEALATAARLPMDHGEPIQLQRYQDGGEGTD